MRNKKNFIFIFVILFLNFSVLSENLKNNIFIENNNLYKKCRKELKKNNFYKAIFNLKKIENNSLTNINKDKVQINLIYAYYKVSNFSMAEKNIQKFIKLYPNHPNIDYVLYMQSLINITLDKKIFYKFLPIQNYNSDPIYAIKAFFALKKFITNYPDSEYVVNAKKDLFHLKIRLSEYDLKILKYYFFNKKYIAVINRGQEILQKYPETSAAMNTLKYMEKSFFELKIFDTAKKISKIILLNKM